MVEDIKKIGTLRIDMTQSAATLLDLAHSMGLYDIQKWVSEEDVQQFLDTKKWIAFIASDSEIGDGMPCGVVSIGIEEEGRLWIELIAVDETYRRRGVATTLINCLIKWGQTNKQRALFVDVDDDNYPAVNLYKSTGFRQAGKIDEYYYDSSTAMVFVKKL
ncbi:MAG: GNAT family N-acetyltransferase [Candidatus Thorarchaeota archaeon]|nr:GNAT family N-acetyltransferase [Candidatus Thorarchaeota archaeon]